MVLSESAVELDPARYQHWYETPLDSRVDADEKEVVFALAGSLPPGGPWGGGIGWGSLVGARSSLAMDEHVSASFRRRSASRTPLPGHSASGGLRAPTWRGFYGRFSSAHEHVLTVRSHEFPDNSWFHERSRTRAWPGLEE